MVTLKARNKGGAGWGGGMSIWCCRQTRDGQLKQTGAARGTNVAVSINVIDTDGQTFARCYFA
jgi:hypothetical protein